MFSVNASKRQGNLDREEEADGSSSEACQLSSTREGKVGLVNHICLKRKGLGDLGSEGAVLSIIRQWSDLTLGRW